MDSCACGCGTPVAPGKQWIRGHNMRAMSGPRPISRPAVPARPQSTVDDNTDDDDDERWWERPPDVEPLSYEAAAEETPDDPDPARLPHDPVPGDFTVTRAMRRDVEAKTAFWLLTGCELWGMADPYCAQIGQEHSVKIAKKAAPILCQSPQLVAWFVRASGFMMATELLMACKPVIAAVIAHHVTRSVQRRTDDQGNAVTERADWSAYTARAA